jgi:hypothetical protein
MAEERSDDQDRLLRYLAATVESIRGTMATKFGEIESRMATMATKDDLKRLATKDDVTILRGDIGRVELRLDHIDRAVTTRQDQFDLSLSRLRSAVYLLAKDQPEIQRLLGEG